MVMPNIGAFIAWGFITALFIPDGWLPSARLAALVDPMLRYLLPMMIAYAGGRSLAGDRGGIAAVVAVMGVIVGSDIPMFIGAMAIGPLAGWVIRTFDRYVQGHVPAGFEMLVNNFSVGILGMLCAIAGYFAVGPVVEVLTALLGTGVAFIMERGLLPLVSVFLEPAKVLFLNNAVNHGIFSPIGLEQARLSGQSVMFLLETNPGPGLGVLLAYWAFARGAVRNSAPGAALIQFFGGIHEIYFPYILMRPVLILAPIAGSAAAILLYSLTGTGLVAPASPGSIFSVLALAPKGEALWVLAGVAAGAAVSFLVAAPFVRRGVKTDPDFSAREVQGTDIPSGPLVETPPVQPAGDRPLHRIVFACDAGMGSSAMGATRLRRRIEGLHKDTVVTNAAVDRIPPDADLVVVQSTLADRARSAVPQAEVLVIDNFLNDPALDRLYERIRREPDDPAADEITGSKFAPGSDIPPRVEAAEHPAAGPPSNPARGAGRACPHPAILMLQGIRTGLRSVPKDEAIRAAGHLLEQLGYVRPGYAEAMVERERLTSTYLGMGIAIPHGTAAAKKEVVRSGIVVLQYPDGVDFGADEPARLVIGIAGVGDEHLEILARLSGALEDPETLHRLMTTSDREYILWTLG